MQTNQTKQKQKREREKERVSVTDLFTKLKKERTRESSHRICDASSIQIQNNEAPALRNSRDFENQPKKKKNYNKKKKRRIEIAWKRVCESSELTVLLGAPGDLQARPGKAPSRREKEREFKEFRESQRVCVCERERKSERVDISGASDWAGRRYSLNFQIPKGNFLLFPLLLFLLPRISFIFAFEPLFYIYTFFLFFLFSFYGHEF